MIIKIKSLTYCTLHTGTVHQLDKTLDTCTHGDGTHIVRVCVCVCAHTHTHTHTHTRVRFNAKQMIFLLGMPTIPTFHQSEENSCGREI